jgi:hypothetical protein
MSKPKYGVGDWLSFTSNNNVVIGQVCYIHKDVLNEYVYVTTVGQIGEDCVHECRPAKSGVVRSYDTKVR